MSFFHGMNWTSDSKDGGMRGKLKVVPPVS
jgi:hypothetical protein